MTPLDAREQRTPTVAEVISNVAKETGFTVAMLVGDRRLRSIVEARHMAYWRAARETGASLSVIGRAFGNRDHTSILHGIRRHEERLGLISPAFDGDHAKSQAPKRAEYLLQITASGALFWRPRKDKPIWPDDFDCCGVMPVTGG